ncbi:MAG: peptide ligase PGM1-related protein [Actinomycetota bacterium]
MPSFPHDRIELLRRKMDIQSYEDEMLFTLLLLRRPDLHLAYVSSVDVPHEIIDYYLGFLPDVADARRRLTLISLGDDQQRPLSAKVLEREDVLAELRERAREPRRTYLLSTESTPLEASLAETLGIEILGSPPHLSELGYKTGSRLIAREAGVAVLEGAEGLHSLKEAEREIERLRAGRPEAEAVAIKLDRSFGGQGNAILELAELKEPLERSEASLGAHDSWHSFGAQLEEEGAIVEEFVRVHGTASPSVQLRISPQGDAGIMCTHDQILGGPKSQGYVGSRFPADDSYRREIEKEAMKVASVLARKGVRGLFGVDFLVVPEADEPAYLIEINLRMTATLRDFLAARAATAGTYEPRSGHLVADGVSKSYVAISNLRAEKHRGTEPAAALEMLQSGGLAFDPASRVGVVLHMIGALRAHGRFGATCIADSIDDAEGLRLQLLDLFDARTGTPKPPG